MKRIKKKSSIQTSTKQIKVRSKKYAKAKVDKEGKSVKETPTNAKHG